MENSKLQISAYNYIKRKLLNCEYMPGTLLYEKDLMQELEMGRTPVREALIRLEQENLVYIFPKRGIQVCDVTICDVMEVFEVRMMVETDAIRRHGLVLETDKLLEFKAAFLERIQESPGVVLYDMGDQFHSYLWSCITNQFIRNMMLQVYERNYRMRILSFQGGRTVKDLDTEHIKIIDALVAGDIPRAEAALLYHLERSRQALLRRFDAKQKPH